MSEDYFKVEALSKSGLVKFNQSPAHFKAPEKPRSAIQQANLDIGSAFHCLTLEPQNFEARFSILSEGTTLTTKAGKEAKAEAQEAGKILLKFDDYQNIKGMSDAVMAHPGARTLIEAPGPVEEGIFWDDPEYGFKWKIKPDKRTPNCLINDLKSTGDAREDEFNRTAYNLKYHWQAFLYLWGCTISTGIPHTDFIFIVVERAEPWGVKTYFADIDMLLLAAKEVAPLRKLYARCLEKDEWPCYSTEPSYMHLPPWVRKKDLLTGTNDAQFLLAGRSAT